MRESIRLISEERERQITEEGWSEQHDDYHTDGSLAVFAAGLAVDGTDASVEDPLERVERIDGRCQDGWGLLQKFGYNGSKPDEIRALVIAGALIAAEIDRVLRRQGQ